MNLYKSRGAQYLTVKKMPTNQQLLEKWQMDIANFRTRLSQTELSLLHHDKSKIFELKCDRSWLTDAIERHEKVIRRLTKN